MYNRLQASAFLVPPPYSFWTWSEDGRVLCWRGGDTIAFLPELEEVLEVLADEGFPPLSSVALVLGACRGAWRESGAEALASFVLKNCGPYVEDKVLPQLADGLDRLRALPLEARYGRAAKAALCRAVFQGHIPRRSPFESRAILEGLREDERWHPGAAPLPYHDLIEVTRSLSALADRLLEVDAEVLGWLAATGLEKPITSSEDAPAGEALLGLIDALQEERDELGQVARLARRMLAAFALPRRVSSPDVLPIGGLSDLANSGPLDRLLASELAYDNLILAARIANKEALYWRRESPPRRPPAARRLLLDCGLRMWGVPRLHGLAAALALMAGPGGERGELFAARGAQAEHQRVHDRDGLTRILGLLEPEAHPGAALPHFFEAAADCEHVLITTEEVIADPDFERAWRAADEGRARPELFVLTVGRDGRASLSRRGARGWKLLKEARLELEPTLGGAPPGRPLIEPEDRRLPPLFFRRPFPLRLPVSTHDARRAAFSPAHGFLAATRDGRLLSWDPSGAGADQLTDALPRGRLALVKILEDGRGLLVFLREGVASIVQASLADGACRVMENPVADPAIHGAAEHRGALFLIVNKRRVHVLHTDRYRALETLALPAGTRWTRDRFFERGGEPRALSYDGFRPRLEKVPGAGPGWWVFDRCGHDGPWIFDPEGRAISTATGRSIEIPNRKAGKLYRPIAASGDGHRLVFHGSRSGEVFVFDLALRRFMRDWGRPQDVLNREFQEKTNHGQNLRTRFRACGLDNQGRLVLLPKARSQLRLQLNAAGDAVVLAPASPLLRVRAEFKPREQRSARRFRLATAELGGFRAMLDGRGLLHLISSDPSQPSVAVVLLCSALGLWFSDGAYAGPGEVLAPDARERRLTASQGWRRLLDWLARAGGRR